MPTKPDHILVRCSLFRGGGKVLSGTEERIAGLGTGMAVKATGRAASCFVAPHAAAMVGSFKTEGIAMVTFAILSSLLEMVGRERLCRMTIATGDALAGAAAVVTAHAIRIFRCGASGVMMAFATISDHVDMTGVIELNRGVILAELVNQHLCRRRCSVGGKCRQTGNESEGGGYDRNDHFDLHDVNLSLSTRKRSTGRRSGGPVSNNRRQR